MTTRPIGQIFKEMGLVSEYDIQQAVAAQRKNGGALGAILLKNGLVTEEDVRREIVVFADRADISEEMSRLKGHVEMMRALKSREEACGRRLEFVAQEMFREANTMASKSNDTVMLNDILDIKTEIEKLREQALNVE